MHTRAYTYAEEFANLLTSVPNTANSTGAAVTEAVLPPLLQAVTLAPQLIADVKAGWADGWSALAEHSIWPTI